MNEYYVNFYDIITSTTKLFGGQTPGPSLFSL